MEIEDYIRFGNVISSKKRNAIMRKLKSSKKYQKMIKEIRGRE